MTPPPFVEIKKLFGKACRETLNLQEQQVIDFACMLHPFTPPT